MGYPNDGRYESCRLAIVNRFSFSVFGEVIDLPGFNDAVYNWETFQSNTFFSLFTTDFLETKYGFNLRLTCQKPIPTKVKYILFTHIMWPIWYGAHDMLHLKYIYDICIWYVTYDLYKHFSQNITISGDKCMMWSDIFEDWPKAEIVNGTRTFEFLPSYETFVNTTHRYQVPVSLYNVTYITWEDNRPCDNSIRFFENRSTEIRWAKIVRLGYFQFTDWTKDIESNCKSFTICMSYPWKMSENFRRWSAGMFRARLVFYMILSILLARGV